MTDRVGLEPLDEYQGYTFTFSLNDSATSFRGSDGRTGTRRESEGLSGEGRPSMPMSMHQDVMGRPSKRRRKAPEAESRVKRPVGRPRKRPLWEGTSVQLGSFIVPGTARSQSLPCSGPLPSTPAERPIPLVPIFTRSTISPLPLQTTTLSRAPDAPAATIPPFGSSLNISVGLKGVGGERIVSEDDGDFEDVDPDDEADGSGEGAGDESNDEGDDEDPAEVNFGSDRDEDDVPSKAKNYRAPLPDWLQAEFDSCIQDCKDRDSRGWPRLYSHHKTFWFPRQSSWFLMQNTVPSPQRLFNPCFFLWDPQALTQIPCPNCKHDLNRHSYIKRPRRCVSFATTFWIIGYRYQCLRCTKAKVKGRNVTFRSWDSRIMDLIPPELAAEFPARLSHRSAIDVSTFEFMRSMFQNGLGSKQFSDALRVQHRLQHHKLELQYLQHLASREITFSDWSGPLYDTFPAFDDKGPNGRHGYIPSGDWLRDMYDSYIETHSQAIDQHMALLSAEVCAIDHSHKYTKYIIQLNGERVFTPSSP
ncbi:hypothetical protein BKA70DRAFT_1568128 [Coprinopsis sp. MPI-PUGE-AT-0042]|nr:hypothetical protein BKA70DRAFT_1568128 [Coprinopsis sp. MPI-PUGE-AT-0042]